MAVGDHVGVDADRGGRRAGRVGRVGAHRLGGQGADLAGGVGPSSVVRSTIRIARSRAYALAVVLIERVPSAAARASAPTWSTPGQAVQEPAQRGLGPGDVGEVGRVSRRGWVGMAASIGLARTRAESREPPDRTRRGADHGATTCSASADHRTGLRRHRPLVAAVGAVVLILADADGDPSCAGRRARACFFGAVALGRAAAPAGGARRADAWCCATCSAPSRPAGGDRVGRRCARCWSSAPATSASPPPAVGRSAAPARTATAHGGSAAGRAGAGHPAGRSATAPEKPEAATTSYGLFVEERIRARVADALAKQGVRRARPSRPASPTRITRRPAWPEIVVLAVSLGAFVVLLLG